MENRSGVSGILHIMNMQFIGAFLTLLGDVIVAVVVFNVHGHVLKEKRIDKDVLDTMRKERKMVIFGILLVIIGFMLQWMPA